MTPRELPKIILGPRVIANAKMAGYIHDEDGRMILRAPYCPESEVVEPEPIPTR